VPARFVLAGRVGFGARLLAELVGPASAADCVVSARPVWDDRVRQLREWNVLERDWRECLHVLPRGDDLAGRELECKRVRVLRRDL
jgi:hypothetical protein